METVREILDRMERELLTSIEALRTGLVPLEAELANVRRAKAAVVAQEAPPTPLVGPAKPVVIPESAYINLTMKQLALKALREQFPNGATASQLLDHFINAWGRTDIVRPSLSPQLSRLKLDRKIRLVGKTWVLAGPKENEASPDSPDDASEAAGEQVPGQELPSSYQLQLPDRDPG
jgi:hypothetical protein